LQKIQCRSFTAEQGAGRTLCLAYHLPGTDPIPVPRLPGNGDGGVELPEDLIEPGCSAQHGVFPGHDRGGDGRSCGHEQGRTITAAEVFV